MLYATDKVKNATEYAATLHPDPCGFVLCRTGQASCLGMMFNLSSDLSAYWTVSSAKAVFFSAARIRLASPDEQSQPLLGRDIRYWQGSYAVPYAILNETFMDRMMCRVCRQGNRSMKLLNWWKKC